MEKLNKVLVQEVEQIKQSGRAKKVERVINGYQKAIKDKGERYFVEGYDKKEFLRLNSNNYLGLSTNEKLITAADDATHKVGVGPGAVRFIDGTFSEHIHLEKDIARFTGKPSARIFNSAYTSNLALALTLSSPTTYWIGDELNHNSIIRAMRIANVPKTNRSFFLHNDMKSLEGSLSNIPEGIKRVCIIFDGIFSMRGDYAPLDKITSIARSFDEKYEEGVITIIDDSHGIAAYGDTGRGTCEFTNTNVDIIVGTFGKAFGVNGGFIASSKELTELIRQKADTYIYTNPLSVADCAAASAAIKIVDSEEGKKKLAHLHTLTKNFRQGLQKLGLETIAGPHPVVPILIRDTKKTEKTVKTLFDLGILVVGLTFPVVPQGAETIRCQVNAGLTESDILFVLESIKKMLA